MTQTENVPGPLFQKLDAAEIGIDFVHQWKPRDRYQAQLLKTGFTGGGVCLGDYDGDGFCDVFLTRPQGGGRLYHNLGDFRFEDVTVHAGVLCADDWTTGAAFVDVDNDGHLDLNVCAYDSNNHLYVNQGDGTFRDVAAQAGLHRVGANVKMVFADYDNDGDLDAFLVTNRLEPKSEIKVRYLGGPGRYTVAPEHQELVGIINLPSGEQKFTKAGQFDRLFRNELKETGLLNFTDVTKHSGIVGNFHGLDAIWWDYDSNGYPDLYVANDFTDPDQFLRNNGDGTFTDVTQQSLPHTPWFAMGAAAGDLNNDGRFDLVATDMAGTTHYREKIAMGSMDAVAWFLDTAEPRQYMRNAVFVNTGTNRFLEVAHMAGLASSDWTWSVKLADLDNDGLEDVFVTNGFTRDYLNSDFNERLKQKGTEGNSLAWYEAPELRERNLAFRNLGDLRFQNVSTEWGLDELGISFGAALGDLDNDGDLDLITSNFGTGPSIYRNQATGQGVRITLQGTLSNASGIGARVEIQTPSGTQTRYHNPGNGFLSANEPALFFGMGHEDSIDKVTIHWPSGAVQTLANMMSRRRYEILEPDHVATADGSETAAEREPPLFEKSDVLQQVTHRERHFDDFARQPLLPNRMSQLGPGMAVGDVDGDGDSDLFVGGAAGQVGQLLIRNPDGRFKAVDVPTLKQHAECEDMGCLLLDVDADGDQDLFVVSGGVECDAGGELLKDRLYLNDGQNAGEIEFRYVPDALPDYRDSGGIASAADFDRDGDLDLFVGGRVVPHAYPTTPNSHLLRNDSGKFTDVAPDVATELANIGMVTSAIWSDVNDDGWIDLLLTIEYGAIKVFRNDNGILADASAEFGTSELFGWWNSISGCDVDDDGDIDYAVGNLGLNTKYHPTPGKPQYIFYGDFDETGKNSIVEAKPGSDGLLPVRGRSCSSSAMPFLKDKFKTYHSFASATLADIYTEACLSEALRLEAHIAASGILLNDGSGKLVFHPLPRLAQVSPIFGMQFLLANDDQHADLFVAHNSFSPQRETGRMDGGLGLVLLGNGDGSFRPIDARSSGISIPVDAKSAVSTDLNGDAAEDLIVGVNNGAMATYVGSRSSPALRIRLAHCDAPGARLTVDFASGRRRAIELYKGSGYLSQNDNLVVVGFDEADRPIRCLVRWPEGAVFEVNVPDSEHVLSIPHPKSAGATD